MCYIPLHTVYRISGILYSVIFLGSIKGGSRYTDHKKSYDIPFMVNSIDHPEFKSTQPVFNEILQVSIYRKVKCTNLKHAQNLTETEIDFKIEVMLNFLENISQFLFLL